MDCLFISDLHGKKHLYEKLFDEVQKCKPDVVLIGGDLFPHGYLPDDPGDEDFLTDFFIKQFSELKRIMKEQYPWFLIILGNDDPRSNESRLLKKSYDGHLWNYLHNRNIKIGDYKFFGYSFIPPSPFGLKDWEKYDVSRFVDPGCTHPFEGMRSVDPDFDPEYSNIKEDLVYLTREENLSNSVFLFHSPPYNTSLDRAALDGKMVDHVPLDVHVGSIAIQRFIEERQPLVTLHGHVHEASSITGGWRTQIGNTHAFNAAYDKDKLSIIHFDPAQPEKAERRIV
jgi:Icc-related predicted phosphoesterase